MSGCINYILEKDPANSVDMAKEWLETVLSVGNLIFVLS